MNILKISVSFIFVYSWVADKTCCYFLLAHSSLYTKPPTVHYTKLPTVYSTPNCPQLILHQTAHSSLHTKLPTVHSTPNRPQFTPHQTAHSSVYTKPFTQPAVSCYWPPIHTAQSLLYTKPQASADPNCFSSVPSP